ncbi:hypothetical protein ACE400_29480, partial [Salmonella enterica]|uniref:hypothetical protein n=1 Tax=Salmonella enterica TaxID=28901 RepID=UPI003D270EE1
DGGWVDRQNANPAVANAPLLHNVNSAATQVGRIALKWVPVDGLEITPSLHVQRKVTDDVSNTWEQLSPAGGRQLSGAPNASPDRDRF